MKRKKRRHKAQKKTRRTKTRCAPTGGRRDLPSYVSESGVPAGAAGAHISSPAVLRQALAFLQAGRPQEALRLYRQILTAQPDHTDALNLGGVA
ncbi:MAG TPA: tetratricopeptide repeat protein, partial [Rhodospirillales bacterium]|nr:tetratricopeptide repeat protein [Rhodospirillales bacterium]